MSASTHISEVLLEPKAMYGKAIPSQSQRKIYDFIEKYQRETGCCPSFEEIGKAIGLSSLATVSKHVSTMADRGIITRGYCEARAIVLNPEYALGIYIRVTQ